MIINGRIIQQSYAHMHTWSTQPVRGSITLIFLSLHVVAKSDPLWFHAIEYIVLLWHDITFIGCPVPTFQIMHCNERKLKYYTCNHFSIKRRLKKYKTFNRFKDGLQYYLLQSYIMMYLWFPTSSSRECYSHQAQWKILSTIKQYKQQYKREMMAIAALRRVKCNGIITATSVSKRALCQ